MLPEPIRHPRIGEIVGPNRKDDAWCNLERLPEDLVGVGDVGVEAVAGLEFGTELQRCQTALQQTCVRGQDMLETGRRRGTAAPTRSIAAWD